MSHEILPRSENWGYTINTITVSKLPYLISGSVTENKNFILLWLTWSRFRIRCTNKLIKRTHILTVSLQAYWRHQKFWFLLVKETAFTMTLAGTDYPTEGIWLALISVRMLTLKIHIGTSKDTACMSTTSPPDLFVLLVPLPPYKKACLHWYVKVGFEMRFPPLPVCEHLNKTTFHHIRTHNWSIGFWSSRQPDLCLVTALMIEPGESGGPQVSPWTLERISQNACGWVTLWKNLGIPSSCHIILLGDWLLLFSSADQLLCLAGEGKQVMGGLVSPNWVKPLVCTTRSPQIQFGLLEPSGILQESIGSRHDSVIKSEKINPSCPSVSFGLRFWYSGLWFSGCWIFILFGSSPKPFVCLK